MAHGGETAQNLDHIQQDTKKDLKFVVGPLD